MSKTVTLQLTPELADLLIHALRDYTPALRERMKQFNGVYFGGYDQPGRLEWLATYIEHKLRDAR